MRCLAVILLLCTSLCAEAQAERLIILTPRRPVIVEFQITIDGKPYAQAWYDYLDKLFHDFDIDRDGWLSRTEAARAPNADFVASFLHGALNLEAAAAAIPFDELDTGRRGKVSRHDFGDYYRRTRLNRLSVAVGPEREKSLALTDALYDLLGQGTDRVTLDDLKRARELLQRVDLNEDEWITPAEILLQAPDKPTRKRPRPTLETLGLLPLEGTPSPRVLASVLTRFPTWNERALGAPVAVLAVRLGRNSNTEPAVELIGGDAGCQRIEAGVVRLSVDGMEVDIRIGPGTVSRALGMHAYYRQQFQAADSGRRGFINARQIEDFPALASFFRIADRDGDGQLTNKEFEAFLALHADGVQSFVTLTVSDQSPGLFELLDENGDGRLSLRELHTAGERLRGLIPNPTAGGLQRKDLPRRLELQMARGGSTPRLASPGPGAGPVAPRGPAWFRHMDRNGDGYVSRREFLGSLNDFKKMDLDGDGLISPEEAEKFEALPRQEH
jgi:Ca2+-binding EF-hand superfamily protein